MVLNVSHFFQYHHCFLINFYEKCLFSIIKLLPRVLFALRLQSCACIHVDIVHGLIRVCFHVGIVCIIRCIIYASINSFKSHTKSCEILTFHFASCDVWIFYMYQHSNFCLLWFQNSVDCKTELFSCFLSCPFLSTFLSLTHSFSLPHTHTHVYICLLYTSRCV